MPIGYTDCPYCYSEQEIDFEGIEQGDYAEEECSDCGKKFKYYWEASVDICSTKTEDLI